MPSIEKKKYGYKNNVKFINFRRCAQLSKWCAKVEFPIV